jgi:hypothetical protein
MIFTRVATRTKSKGLLIGGPLFSKTYSFYKCSIAYKKQEAPDQRSLIQQKLMLFYTRSTAYKKQGAPDRCSAHLLLLSARASPRTKSKGLPIGAPHIFYYFQHTLHRVQKARGSIGMCSKFIILLKFSNVFAAQRVSSTLCIIQTISHQTPIGRFNILLVYNCYQYTRSKGHLFIFIFIKFIQHAKEKDYRALGLSLSSGSARLVKLYEVTKS